MKKITRHQFLKASGIAITGASLAALSACSSSSSTATSTSTSTSTSADSATVNEEFSYPMDAMDIELSIFAPQMQWAYNTVSSQAENYFHANLPEFVGVDMDWINVPYGSDVTQAYNLVLTDSVLPDIIFHANISTDAATLLADGVAVPLNDYIETYAPNYWQMMQDNEILAKSTKTDDGVIYGFCYFPEPDPATTIWEGPMVRQDLLNELGLDLPVTLDDWDVMLKALYDYNGTQFAAISGSHLEMFFGACDVKRDWFLSDDGNEILYGPALDGYKEALTYMSKWYKAGYINKDYATMDQDTYYASIVAGEISSAVTHSGHFTNLTNMFALNGLDGEMENWVAVPYPVRNKGDMVHFGQLGGQVGNGTIITTDCFEDEERFIAALRWCDYGYSPEGSMHWSFGTEGESYTMVDGEPVFTDLIWEAQDQDQAIRYYTGSRGSYCGYRYSAAGQWADGVLTAFQYPWEENQDIADHVEPLLLPTADETYQTSSYITSIETYESEMFYKFVRGDISIEDEFENFKATLESMHLSEVLEVKNVQLDRYKAR